MLAGNKQNVYMRITESIKRDIRTGAVADGERLPSCRELAIKLGVNPNTVQRAYAELEAQGFLEAVPKKGVYARRSPIKTDLVAACEDAISSFARSGLSRADIERALDKVYGEENK